MTQFVAAARGSDWAKAGRYLDLRGESSQRGPELAQRLKAVLDRWSWLEPSELSPSSEGSLDDGLPANVEEIGRIPMGKSSEPIRLVRREAGEGTHWLFSAATVGRIDDWYDRLDDRWLREHLPESLMKAGPRDLLWWQWLALPLLFLLGFAIGIPLALLARRLLKPVVARTKATWDDELLVQMTAPLALLFALLAIRALDPSLTLNRPAEAFLHQLLRAGLLLTLFWALLRSMDLGASIIRDSSWAQTRPSSLALLPLGTRILKLGAVAMAAIAVLSELGYPVASLLAGLGIGGLALALAAQKTVENLFGSVAISVDQPFRIGDFVKIENVSGTVEYIGLRSTRVRTLDRTVVSFPNGKLADMRTESFGPRDRILFTCNLNLAYGTTSSQIRQVIDKAQQLLLEHPKLHSASAPTVRLSELQASTMRIEVFAQFATTNWDEFTLIRQEVLLKLLEVVEQAGIRIALPAQTLHLASGAEKT